MRKYLKDKIKKICFFFLYFSKITGLIFYFIKKRWKDFPSIILIYHRFIDDKNCSYLNKGPVVQHKVKHFEKEIKYLKKYFKVETLDKIVTQIKAHNAFDNPTISITFDDGYLDNYELAYPILKKEGIPATVYVTTGLIGSNERTWTDEIELALMGTKKEFLQIDIHGESIMPISTIKDRERANIRIAELLKRLPDEERREHLKSILEILDDKSATQNGKERRMLNWDEVKEMAAENISIGVHTHTHGILSKMPLGEAKREIFLSKKIVEEKLGTPAKHFSFPNGREEDFSEILRDYCKEIGFESVTSAVHGVNDPNRGDRFSLRRMGAVSPVWMMAGELLKEILRWCWKNGKPALM